MFVQKIQTQNRKAAVAQQKTPRSLQTRLRPTSVPPPGRTALNKTRRRHWPTTSSLQLRHYIPEMNMRRWWRREGNEKRLGQIGVFFFLLAAWSRWQINVWLHIFTNNVTRVLKRTLTAPRLSGSDRKQLKMPHFWSWQGCLVQEDSNHTQIYSKLEEETQGESVDRDKMRNED